MLKSFSDFINCKGKSDTLKLMKNSCFSGGGGWDGSFYIGSMVFDHWKKNQNIYDMNF